MESWLTKLWDKITSKLGALARFIPMMAEEVKFRISEGDLEGANARLDEADEMLDQGKVVVAKLRAGIADGSITANESAGVMVELERFLDEAEDVFTNVDEDKPTDPPAPA